MKSFRRSARINVKLLVILALGAGILAAGGLLGHRFRKRAMADTALSAGNAAWERQDYVEASKHLRQYLSKYPDDAPVLERYAEANLAIRPIQPEKIGAAIGAYRRLMRQASANPHIWKELVKIYSGTGQHNEAAYICRQRLESSPQDSEAMIWLGKALFSQRKYDEAAEILTRLEGLETSDLGARRRQVQACGLMNAIVLQDGSPTGEGKALEWLDRAVKKHPNSAEAHAQRARYYRTVKRDETLARQDLDAAEKLNSDDPGVRLLLIDERMQWGQFEAARTALSSVENVPVERLEQFDIDLEAWAFARYSTACRLALLEKRIDEGMVVAEKALSELRDFRRMTLLPTAVELYLAGGRLEDARGLVNGYREYLKERADIPESMQDQAVVLAASVAEAAGDAPAVIQLLDNVPTTRLTGAQAWKLLWRSFEKTGQTRRQRHALEEYVSRSRLDGEALKTLAEANRERDWSKVVSYAGRAERLGGGDLAATLLRLEGQIKTTPIASESALRGLTDEIAKLQEQHPRHGILRVLQAGIEFRHGRHDEAVRILEQAITSCDPDYVVDLALVNVLGASGQSERAITVCRSSVERHARLATPRLRLSELLSASGQEEEAHRVLVEAAKNLTDEEKAQAGFALARHAVLHNQPQVALVALRESALERPDDIRPRTALLALPEVQKNFPASQQIVDEIKRIEGEKRGVQWRVEQAKLWLRDGSNLQNRQVAIEELLNDCMSNDPGWSAPVALLGRCYEQLGRNDAAESLYRRQLEATPGELTIARSLLALLERQGRFTDAEQVLRRLPAGTAALNEHRLSIALGKEDFASALDELNQRIAAESENASLLVLKAGLIHSLQKNVSEALSWLDKAEALQPDLLDIAGTRAAILHAAGRTDEARRILDELVSKRQDTAAYLLRSRLSLQTKQFEQAEQDLLQAASHEGPNEEGHLALGRFYQEQGREVPAITAYEQGLKRNPTQLELQRGLLGVLLKSAAAESRERGRKLLDELRGKYPDDTRLIAVAADFKLQEKTPAAMKEASTLLERVVTLDPRNVAVYVRLIELAQQREDRRSVDALISRAMGANPGDDDLQLVRAGIESEAGNVAVSRELGRSVLDRARRTISQDSSDEAARRRLLGACTLLADLALRGKDSAEARRYSEEALKTDPSGEQAQLSHARVLDATGQAAEAISVLEAYRQSEAGHDNVSTLVALSDLYRRQRNFTSAEDRLREALAKRPESLAVQFAQLQLFASQKRWNDVAERLSEGGANTEVDPRVALLGATLLIDSGDDRHLAKARAICDQLVAKQPDRVDAQITLAQVAYRQRQLPVSEQAYRHVLQIEPYHVQALNDLAWILAVDQGQPEQALALADKGALRFPDDPHLLDTRGVVYTMLNRLPEARRDFERCLALSALPLESRAQALFHLGRVLVKQGETAAAQSKLNEALKLDEQHRVFSDGERAEIRNLIGSP